MATEEKTLGKSKEDYLEAILVLNQRNGWCREVDIANHLHFSMPSVSVALGKLEDAGFLTRENNGAVLLTEVGLAYAERTLEKHLFFRELLLKTGIDADTAENEACLMEHVICDDSFEKIKAYISSLS